MAGTGLAISAQQGIPPAGNCVSELLIGLAKTWLDLSADSLTPLVACVSNLCHDPNALTDQSFFLLILFSTRIAP